MITNNWSTPFYTSTIDSNSSFELVQSILAEYDYSGNVFDLKNESVQKFKDNVVIPHFNNFLKSTLNKELKDWGSHTFHGWVVSYNDGRSLEYHNHKGSQVSSVFYLLCEDDATTGQITFTDPRQNANRGYDPSFFQWFEPLQILPKTNDVVIFPSFLYHSVSTYRSNVRIALPVDLFLNVEP
jgi:hypothetical protein